MSCRLRLGEGVVGSVQLRLRLGGGVVGSVPSGHARLRHRLRLRLRLGGEGVDQFELRHRNML
jgi:hypothetical protein